MNALPKSVLISDLKSSLNSYNSDYNSYKSNYDSTNKLYSLWVNTGDYLEAKNNLNPNLQNQLNQLNTNLNVLSSSIEERIKLHNEVTDNLNKLKEDSANLEAKVKLFGQDVSGLSSQVDSLESTFELGSFTSYSDIQDKVSSLKNQINSESSNLDKKVVGIIKDGNNLVLLESSKFNSSIQYSVVNAKDLEGIKIFVHNCLQ